MTTRAKMEKPLDQRRKCQILETRYKEQAANLRDLNQYDFRLFGGFLTVQLVVAGWFAAHPSSIFVAVGLFLIDLALLAVCIRIMWIHRQRRNEIRETIIRINEAFELYTPDIYLRDKAINPPPKESAGFIWPAVACGVGVVGVAIALFVPLLIPVK